MCASGAPHTNYLRLIVRAGLLGSCADAADPQSVVLKGHKGTLSCLAFASDGKTLATGGIDRNVALWNFERLLADHAKK
jgi:WD40 repeat protein